jgi:hypothetical protein
VPLLTHGLTSVACPSRETGPWHGAGVQGLRLEHEGGSRVAPSNKRGSGAHPNDVATMRGGGRGEGGKDLWWPTAREEWPCRGMSPWPRWETEGTRARSSP